VLWALDRVRAEKGVMPGAQRRGSDLGRLAERRLGVQVSQGRGVVDEAGNTGGRCEDARGLRGSVCAAGWS